MICNYPDTRPLSSISNPSILNNLPTTKKTRRYRHRCRPLLRPRCLARSQRHWPRGLSHSIRHRTHPRFLSRPRHHPLRAASTPGHCLPPPPPYAYLWAMALQATVIGHGEDGSNIVHTPFATVKIYTDQPLPSGTNLIVTAEVTTQSAPHDTGRAKLLRLSPTFRYRPVPISRARSYTVDGYRPGHRTRIHATATRYGPALHQRPVASLLP